MNCICQICNCGRHRCPHEKRPNKVFNQQPMVKGMCSLSEYQKAYSSLPWQPPRESMRKTSNRSTTVPFVDVELTTTYQKTYVPHQAQSRVKKPPVKYQPPATKLSVASTYDIEFTEKKALPAQSYKPKDKKVTFRKPFEHTSVTQATYTPFDQEELEHCKRVPHKPEENLKTTGSGEKFTAKTTVQDDFKHHENVTPAKSMRPAEKVVASKEPFTAKTSQQAEFTPKTVEPVLMVKPQEQLQKGSKSSTFDGQTTFRRDFPEHTNHKRQQSYKPRAEYVENDTKFDGRTTQRIAYKAWEVQPKAYIPWAEKNKRAPYVKSKFMSVSSYQDDYRDPGMLIKLSDCRGEPCKYENNLGAAGEPFEESTQYKSAYVTWDNVKPAASYKVVQEYKAPTTPLIGKSIFQSHFLGKPAPPAKSCRPELRPHTSSGMISMKTTYNTTYQGKRPLSCPAQRLGNDAKYEHVKDSATGHKFFTETAKV
ncbi:uncharacterized protein [Antedon mediterranea]|uniref:uncharacterized protein n=1 Tax=Antedon mediterranea TaxID=105859 RepID=UPI003AF9CDF5